MSNINKEIKTEYGVVTVHKLPLRTYPELVKLLGKIPQKLVGLGDINLIEQLPIIVEESYEDVVAILTFASSLTENDVNSDNFGLSDAVDVILAILEVNNYDHIYEKIKKKMAQ